MADRLDEWKGRLVPYGAVIDAESVSLPGDVMDSNAQCSPFPCMAANGQREPKQPTSGLESGNVRPKPPVKPKPCVLPKPAMPATLCQVPGLRQPSAEKINLLAGPKPYNSAAGNAVKRLSFSLKSSPREATNGKEISPPLLPSVKPSGDAEVVMSAKKSTAVESDVREEGGESLTARKTTIPFKVKPVPVAAKPERFPGTTVEEILAKIAKPNKEGPNSPERPRLVHSSFSQDGSTAINLGPKGYVAFRRCSSGGEVESESPACRMSFEAQESKLSWSKEEPASSDGQSVLESVQPAKAMEKSLDCLSRDSSRQPSVSCDGSPPGHSSAWSPPGVSLSVTSQPLTKLSSGVTPGSPDVPAVPAQSPGAPCFPADVPSTETEVPPGSPDVLTEMPRSSVEDYLSVVPAPGSPLAREDPCSPGSPLEHFLSSALSGPPARDPEVCHLPGSSASLTHFLAEPLGCLQGSSESPGSPSMHSEYSVRSDQPPGSPSHAHDSLHPRDTVVPKSQVETLPLENKVPQLSQLALRRASEGVVQPQSKKLTKEELGGSLAAIPSGAGPPSEQVVGGESNWSLSQSFEWSFPSRTLEFGGKRSPPRSPIKEADDNELLQVELCGKNPGPKDSYNERNSEGQTRAGEKTDVLRSFPFLSDSRDSQMCGKKAEAQRESTSFLEMSAPGGPSMQREPTSSVLKGPIRATGGDFQEEHDKCLAFVLTQEEGALQAMEPLPSVQEPGPAMESCILFSEDAQIQTAAVRQEEDCTFNLAKEKQIGGTDLLRAGEPEPGSQWLDELLASPPPSADDTKRRSTPKPEDPIGPEDLLGWSRKDLSSEFGIVGADQSAGFDISWAGAISKGDWPGKTEQDQEFGTGTGEFSTSTKDWLTSYSVSDAKKQDMEFGTTQQGWTRATQLQGNPNPGQEDWFTTYGSSCADQQIEERWSNTYNINTSEGHDREPYMRKPGWPRLCSTGDDQENSEATSENIGWSSQYHIGALERTGWTDKYSLENASCSTLGTELSDESNRDSIDSHQDTELKHSETSNDHNAITVASQDATFSASQSGWPNELGSDKNAAQLQSELTAHPKEQNNERGANHPESQVTVEEPLPSTYVFNAGNSQEAGMNAEQSDWSSRYDMGVVQCHEDEIAAEKPNITSEYEDSRISWEREVDATKFGAVDLEFCARKQVWADKYSLGETNPQDNFTAGTMDWIRDTDISGVKEKEPFGDLKETHAGGLVPPGLLRVTVGSEETHPIITGQPEDLNTVVMDEPRGSGEGQSEWTQDLGLTDTTVSSVLQLGNLDVSEDSPNKHPHWFPSTTLESLSDAKLMVPEETRKPGVGQDDLACTGPESLKVSDLRSKALDGVEEAKQIPVDSLTTTGKELKDHSDHFRPTGLYGDEMQWPETMGDSSSRRIHSQRLSSPSRLLEEMVSGVVIKELAQQKRPASFHSCHSEEERGKSSLINDQTSAAEKHIPVEYGTKILSHMGDQLDSGNGSQQLVEASMLGYPEQNGAQSGQLMFQESHVSEEAKVQAKPGFLFLEDTEVLDNTVFRDRANLGRKRGHRAPATRSGGVPSESEGDSWMFKDSTEPRIASAASDEETLEEPRSRKSRNSPLTKGVKVPLFPGLSPSALKAKLRGRNRSSEEGDPQSEVKEAQVQRSKSCKIASGKPLVLPPKPEKTSGSETSSPNWLQVLKLKKKKS